MPLARPGRRSFDKRAIDAHHYLLDWFRDYPGMIDFVWDLFFDPFADSERSVAHPGITETARVRQQLAQNRCGLTIRKVSCHRGL